MVFPIRPNSLRCSAPGAVVLAALGCFLVPRIAEAQMTAAEVAAFYEDFLVQPPKTCADLRARGNKIPTVVTGLCTGAEDSAPADLEAHLRSHIQATQPERKALINGGGVSMGSYQAGRLQGLINDARVEALDRLFGAAVLATEPSELAKVDDRLNRLIARDAEWANLGFHQVAGASAGGMNAMAFAIEVCRNTLLPTFAPETAPPSFLDKTDSVLRRVWMDVGFQKSDKTSWAGDTALLRDDELPASAPSAERNAVFSVDPLNKVISAIEKFFQPSPPVALRAGCSVGVSITVTSLNPVKVDLQGSQLQGSQSGSFLSVTIPVMVDLKMSNTMPPHFEVHAHEPADLSVMTVERDDSQAFLALVRATGALPPALPMVALCEDSTAGTILFGAKKYAVRECSEDEKDKDKALNLIDGGLFNNNPLDLVLDRSSDGPIQKFLFFDQDFTDIPRSTSRAKYKGNTLHMHFQRLLAAIVDVARNQQVASALRRFKPVAGEAGPDKREVVSIGRQSPALSEAGFATSAFLLREFREIDYLAGILDSQSLLSHATWVSKHADVQLLRGFYGSLLSVQLEVDDLVELVDACLLKPSVLALNNEAWGRRCLLAGAARQAAEVIKSTCGEHPASKDCEKATEFAALGGAAKVLEDAAERKKKNWQFVKGFRDDIQRQLELLSARIDETVQNQRSFFGMSSRALDVGLESLFIDELQFVPTIYSDEKDLRVIRGRWNPALRNIVTDLRLVIDRPFWAIEGSRRLSPLWASALDLGSNWDFGGGIVPALSLGVGLGCSNNGHLTWFRCKAVPEFLEDGSFRATTSNHFAMAYVDVSAALFTVKSHPVISFDLGALLTARGGHVWSSDRTWGVGMETGGFLRLGLVRMVSLDFRFVTGLPWRAGANVAKSVGSADFVIAIGWQC